ncbi:Rho GTPase activation protein [Mycena leptocephala]|nr:Rho GTPase activation protein [Mycena leptocephala]
MKPHPARALRPRRGLQLLLAVLLLLLVLRVLRLRIVPIPKENLKYESKITLLVATRGNVVFLDTFGDPRLGAVLLKKYLRDLPEPVIPESLYPIVRRCPIPSSTTNTTDPANVERDLAAIAYIRDVLLPQLPLCVYILLSHVLHLMHDVSVRADSYRMDAHNLAVVLCPNLVASKTNPARDVMMCSVSGADALFMRTPSDRPPASNPAALSEGKTTLGTVLKLCIQRTTSRSSTSCATARRRATSLRAGRVFLLIVRVLGFHEWQGTRQESGLLRGTSDEV